MNIIASGKMEMPKAQVDTLVGQRESSWETALPVMDTDVGLAEGAVERNDFMLWNNLIDSQGSLCLYRGSLTGSEKFDKAKGVSFNRKDVWPSECFLRQVMQDCRSHLCCLEPQPTGNI